MSALRAYGPSGEPLWIPADDGARAHGYHRPHDARPVTVIGDMAPRMTHLHQPSNGEQRRMLARLETERVARQRKGPQCRHVSVLGNRCGRHSGHGGGHR